MGTVFRLVLLAVIYLVNVTSGYPYQSLSGFSSRSQADSTACNTYRLYQRILQRQTTPLVDDFIITLFRQSPITRDILRTETTAVCSSIAELASDLSQSDPAIVSCFNADEVTAVTSVYGGICTRDGGVTDFFTSMTTGFVQVTASSWTSPCMNMLIDLILTCRFPPVDSTSGLGNGPAIYQRKIREGVGCANSRIDTADVSMCGDKSSLKRFFLVFELLLDLSPGVHFTMTDFEL